jgi:hypothetical protein
MRAAGQVFFCTKSTKLHKPALGAGLKGGVLLEKMIFPDFLPAELGGFCPNFGQKIQQIYNAYKTP